MLTRLSRPNYNPTSPLCDRTALQLPYRPRHHTYFISTHLTNCHPKAGGCDLSRPLAARDDCSSITLLCQRQLCRRRASKDVRLLRLELRMHRPGFVPVGTRLIYAALRYDNAALRNIASFLCRRWAIFVRYSSLARRITPRLHRVRSRQSSTPHKRTVARGVLRAPKCVRRR